MPPSRERLEARLNAVLAELEEARARVEALEQQADALQRQLQGEGGDSDDDLTEIYDPDSDDDGASDSGSSDSGDLPELPEPLDDPDGDDEDAPDQPDLKPEDALLEAQLSEELGFDVGQTCDWVIAHIKPVERKLCFDARKYVRTLLVASLRSRLRRDSQFIYPTECENLVCGGATQVRLVTRGVVARSARLTRLRRRRAKPCSSSWPSWSRTSSAFPAWCAAR